MQPGHAKFLPLPSINSGETGNGLQIQAQRAEARVQDRRFLRTVSAAKGISRFYGEVSAVWRRGGAREDQSAALRSNLAGAQASGRGYAAAAADVSGAGGVAHHLLPAGCAS